MNTRTTNHRKALIRDYKGKSKDMGVYMIRNTINGKCYISSSRDIRARINRHKIELKTNSEKIRALQDDWNRFGSGAFEFQTVDLLKPLNKESYDPGEDLAALEQLWLEKLQPYGSNGYNAANNP